MPTINSIDQIVVLSRNVIYGLFTWSWQIMLLLGVAWLALRIGYSRGATERYRTWLIGIAAVAALPLLTILSHSLHLPTAIAPPTFPVAAINPVVPVGLPEITRPVVPWASLLWPALLVFWAAGAIVSLARLSQSLQKLRAIRSAANPVCYRDLGCSQSQMRPSDLAAVSLALSKGIQSPGIAGLLRPVILFPADIVDWTSPEERLSILRHELAHLDRWDHWASLFQSVLSAVLFFHPMLRYACNQLSLERELACDDRVLDIGTPPKAYAESILKAAERSFITDVVHQTASFAAKRKLERRIDMILNPNRLRPTLREWKFLTFSVALIGIATWVAIPAANSQSTFRTGDPQSTPGRSISARPTAATMGQTPTAVVDSTAIWPDTVKRGPLVLQTRGLGALRRTDDGRLVATVVLPFGEARYVQLDQPASVDTRIDGLVTGRVVGIGDTQGTVFRVDISLEGNVPGNLKEGLVVDGTVEVGQLDDVLFVGRPVLGAAESTFSIFKLDPEGKTATRVVVKSGRASINRIQILEGLNEGDRIILSDMATYDGINSISLK